MADVPSEAPHKVAGKGLKSLKNLPPWAYIAIAGGALALFLILRSRSAANSAANTAASDTPNSGGTYDSGASDVGSPYLDPSMFGAYSGGGTLPNGTGSATNPTDSGTSSVTGATTSDTHDISITGGSDSHDISTSISYGDINSPFSTVGGGAPNRPSTHALPKPRPKPPVSRPRPRPPARRQTEHRATRRSSVRA